MALPDILVSGANNNFPVPEEFKMFWYHEVEKIDALKRNQPKKAAKIDFDALIVKPTKSGHSTNQQSVKVIKS